VYSVRGPVVRESSCAVGEGSWVVGAGFFDALHQLYPLEQDEGSWVVGEGSVRRLLVRSKSSWVDGAGFSEAPHELYSPHQVYPTPAAEYVCVYECVLV